MWTNDVWNRGHACLNREGLRAAESSCNSTVTVRNWLQLSVQQTLDCGCHVTDNKSNPFSQCPTWHAKSYTVQSLLAARGICVHVFGVLMLQLHPCGYTLVGAVQCCSRLFSEVKSFHRRQSTFSDRGRRVERQTVRSKHFPSRNTPRHLSSGPRPRKSFMSWLSRASACQLLQ